IMRPTWHHGPPTNLGEVEHGKLKAEQWCLSIEFDLPVILYWLWGCGTASGEPDEGKQGTSHITSHHHAQQYMKYMKAYLTCLQDAFPGLSWRPNHHASLHMNEFLLRYGPMHRWWMFPFERIIGTLQKTNTNHKIGELERTMLETFCAAANIKALMQRCDVPILKEAEEMLKHCCTPYSGQDFVTDM
ncbi:hypothetical protein BDN67DRAFT_877041, partial [Paxillus ammoniavirescens]